MAAIMGIQVIHVLTHDSIGLGEDGPTHQPVEHLSSLRLIPNVSLWRPCDTVESAIAWQMSLEHRTGPSCLVFSRQKLPFQQRSVEQINAIRRGAYVLKDSGGEPEVILIATGSEVSLAMAAASQLEQQRHKIRVVSMPSVDVFEAQDAEYRDSVMPATVNKRIVIEAGASGLWYKYVGLEGKVIGLDRFGDSAPAEILFDYLGFSESKVVNQIKAML
jgi:transketolase